tara:strand:+ start:1723 stop:2550 length:828 start_codon:yes stop_codon:yes gene_type:complete
MKKKDDESEKRHSHIRPQTCRNCGTNGHLYKDCIHPIMSFGIICYKMDNNGNINYLMIQRKDSLSFMEFIRGKYDTNDILYITKLINYMTNSEKTLLLTYNFDNIWNYAWSQNNVKHTNEYIESKRKYNFLCDNNILLSIANISNNNYEQEWGFPKGRRKLKESDLDCAIREFCEETRLSKKDFNIINELEQFEEIFYGTNKILYKHVYYISKIINEVELIIDNTCLEQVREIRDLKWFTYNEVINHIKSYNTERLELFKESNKKINIYESEKNN